MTDFKKNNLIILTGPTAVGKTELSIRLAKTIDAEIISADSMQVYKYMDIGSAKISQDEMKGVPHYMIDFMEPTEDFNVFTFKTMAKKLIKEINGRGKTAMIVGGTGFYIQSVLYDIDFTEEGKSEYRNELMEIYNKNGSDVLYDMLKECDYDATKTIHKNDIKRVIRALEFYHETGKKISEHNEEERNKKSPYKYKYFVLNKPRELLYADIDKRVDVMIENGLVDEVSNLKKMGLSKDNVSMKGLGYKEIISYLNGETTLDYAIEIIKRDTRHFAKRQITWFKREADVIWINKDEFNYNNDLIISHMLKEIYS